MARWGDFLSQGLMAPSGPSLLPQGIFCTSHSELLAFSKAVHPGYREIPGSSLHSAMPHPPLLVLSSCRSTYLTTLPLKSCHIQPGPKEFSKKSLGSIHKQLSMSLHLLYYPILSPMQEDAVCSIVPNALPTT